jgi:hypothetical protein
MHLTDEQGKYQVSYYEYLFVVVVVIIIIIIIIIIIESRDSSVSIALGYGLDDGGSRVRFPAGAGNFSFHHRVQNSSGAHPASYTMGKAAGA